MIHWAHTGDGDALTCRKQGYDAKGVPLCPHGYRLASNRHEDDRRDSKWVCRRLCRRQLRPDLVAAMPTAAIPLEAARQARTRTSFGQVMRLGRTLPNGSLRLASDLRLASSSHALCQIARASPRAECQPERPHR